MLNEENEYVRELHRVRVDLPRCATIPSDACMFAVVPQLRFPGRGSSQRCGFVESAREFASLRHLGLHRRESVGRREGRRFRGDSSSPNLLLPAAPISARPVSPVPLP